MIVELKLRDWAALETSVVDDSSDPEKTSLQKGDPAHPLFVFFFCRSRMCVLSVICSSVVYFSIVMKSLDMVRYFRCINKTNP